MALNDLLYRSSSLLYRPTTGHMLYQSEGSGTPETPPEIPAPEANPTTPPGAEAGEEWRAILTEEVTAYENKPASGYYETVVDMTLGSTNPPDPQDLLDAQQAQHAAADKTKPIDYWRMIPKNSSPTRLDDPAVPGPVVVRYTMQHQYRHAAVRRIRAISAGGVWNYTYSDLADTLGISVSTLFLRFRALEITTLASTFTRSPGTPTYDFADKYCLPDAVGGWEVVVGSNVLRMPPQNGTAAVRWKLSPVMGELDTIASNNMYWYSSLRPFWWDEPATFWEERTSYLKGGVTYRAPFPASLLWQVSTNSIRIWC